MPKNLPNKYPNIFGCPIFTKRISKNICTGKIANIQIRIMLKGHFIQIFVIITDRSNFGKGSLMLSSVVSTNILIFEYSNKMALNYYSYLYLCHFPSTNIFGYSFVDFGQSTIFRYLFVNSKKNQIYLNICPEPYSNICRFPLKKKVNLDITYA